MSGSTGPLIRFVRDKDYNQTERAESTEVEFDRMNHSSVDNRSRLNVASIASTPRVSTPSWEWEEACMMTLFDDDDSDLQSFVICHLIGCLSDGGEFSLNDLRELTVGDPVA